MSQVDKFVRHKTGDADLEKIQDNLQRFFKLIEDCPIINGRLIRDVTFNGLVYADVEHKLGRTPQGYIIVKMSGYPTHVRFQSWDNKILKLYGGAALHITTIDLWVF